jgi:hypothetical protein
MAKIEFNPDMIQWQRDFASLRLLARTFVEMNLTMDQKFEAGSVAAEMLVHFGRGQMAAQLAGGAGATYGVGDLQQVINDMDIFERNPAPSPAERMFVVFAKSVAASQKKGDFNLNSSVRKRVCGYSFLLGNLAWQHRHANKIRLDELNEQFALLQAECTSVIVAGGGEFCHMGPF